jgi:methyltransferase (TIGR00027 family)
VDGKPAVHAIIGTARWAAAQRAQESEREAPLFVDPLASTLSGDYGREALRRSREVNPHHEATAAYIAIRTRFLDELALGAARDGVHQVVLLGAGMDARAFRLPWPAGVTLYEVDHAELLEEKERLLRGARPTPMCHRVIVPVNIEGDWTSALTAAGMSPGLPAVWLLEGLLYYFDDAGAERIVRSVSALSAPGSVLGLDLVSAAYITSPSTRAAQGVMARQGFEWRFGTDEPEAFLARHGWRAQVLRPGEPGAHYGRWRGVVPSRDRIDVPQMFLASGLIPP